MTARTFSKTDFDAAMQAWKDGSFSEEWRSYRHQAAMRGMIFPPEGSKWDSWDDDNPSQRAMLVRAIRETPGLLRQAIDSSKSWGEVVAKVIRRRDEWRDELAADERYDRERRERDDLDHRESTAALASILTRIADSAGVVLPSGKGAEAARPKLSLTVDEGSDTESAAVDPQGSRNGSSALRRASAGGESSVVDPASAAGSGAVSFGRSANGLSTEPGERLTDPPHKAPTVGASEGDRA